MSQEESLDKLAKVGAIGPPAYLITAAGTDAILKNLNIKNPLSQAQLAVLGAVESSKVGKSALKVGGQAAGIIGNYVIDTVVGGMAIGEAAKDTSMSSGQKGYAITGDVIGIAANIGVNVFTSGALGGAATASAAAASAAASAAAGGAAAGGTVAAAGTTATGTLAAGAATGPGVVVALVIVAFQILGGIIDSFANPFQAMFNKDLKQMHDAYHSSLKKAYLDMGLNWPIEIKPDLVGITFGTQDNIDKYRNYISDYYKDNGLITEREFVEDWQLLLDLRKLRRNSRKYIVDENDNVIGIQDPVRNAMDITSDVESNILLMFALAARIAKNKKQATPKKTTIRLFVETYYIAIIFWVILLLIIIFLSIFFLLI
jgi:hypothetical protein